MTPDMKHPRTTNNPQNVFDTQRTSLLLEHPYFSIKIHEADSLIARKSLHVLRKKIVLGKKNFDETKDLIIEKFPVKNT